jgi:hypothetical protein
MAYDTIDQNIVASCLIQSHTDDSFYNPTFNSHTGYAYDGNYYSLGVLQQGHQQASWFTEYGTSGNEFRGSQAAFPAYGLVLLSPVSLAIFNQAVAVTQASQLPLWMQFILGDTAGSSGGSYALTDNFYGVGLTTPALQGFLPQSLCYADGVISVTYLPDPGNQPDNLTHPILIPPQTEPVSPSAQSSMVVSIDFVQDSVYLDVAL